jgi:hypothetical protein
VKIFFCFSRETMPGDFLYRAGSGVQQADTRIVCAAFDFSYSGVRVWPEIRIGGGGA